MPDRICAIPPKRFINWRHPLTGKNAKDLRVAGTTVDDEYPSLEGLHQLDDMITYLGLTARKAAMAAHEAGTATPFDLLIVSPTTNRCKIVAQVIVRMLGHVPASTPDGRMLRVGLVLDDRFRALEIGLGSMTMAQMAQAYPDYVAELTAWTEGLREASPDPPVVNGVAGERIAAFQDRIEAGLRDVVEAENAPIVAGIFTRSTWIAIQRTLREGSFGRQPTCYIEPPGPGCGAAWSLSEHSPCQLSPPYDAWYHRALSGGLNRGLPRAAGPSQLPGPDTDQ
jgi:broad specificity phosphatase PhoE